MVHGIFIIVIFYTYSKYFAIAMSSICVLLTCALLLLKLDFDGPVYRLSKKMDHILEWYRKTMLLHAKQEVGVIFKI